VTVVPGISAKKIIDELENTFGEAAEPYEVFLVKDVTDSYQLGTKIIGEKILTSNHEIHAKSCQSYSYSDAPATHGL
jgi:hypothetical protein